MPDECRYSPIFAPCLPRQLRTPARHANARLRRPAIDCRRGRNRLRRPGARSIRAESLRLGKRNIILLACSCQVSRLPWAQSQPDRSRCPGCSCRPFGTQTTGNAELRWRSYYVRSFRERELSSPHPSTRAESWSRNTRIVPCLPFTRYFRTAPSVFATIVPRSAATCTGRFSIARWSLVSSL